MVLKTIILLLFLSIQIILGLYLLIPFLCILGFAIFKTFRLKAPADRKAVVEDRDFSFGIIITAHQETQMIPPLLDSIDKQTYSNFHAYVVADDITPGKLTTTNPKISILVPNPSLHAKIKSIEFAINNFIQHHDVIIIVDADSLLHPDYLENLNYYFTKGYSVVQTNFKPKNTDTTYARLDAIGDMFNFFIERQIRYYYNLSSTIWGSGVAIKSDLYKEPSYKDGLGGFDRKLQAYLVTKVHRIAFAEDAVLYDEKITSGKSLETQRTRWINSYFKYFKENLAILRMGLKQGDFNLIYFGFNVLRPPLFLTISGFVLATIILGFLSKAYILWGLIILFTFAISFASIVMIKGGFRFLSTLMFLPLFVFRQFSALLRLSEAKKSFMKTSHSRVVYIDDILKGNSSAIP